MYHVFVSYLRKIAVKLSDSAKMGRFFQHNDAFAVEHFLRSVRQFLDNLAIETRPGNAGRIIEQGCANQPDGISRRLGGHAGERFVRADFTGRWNTAIEIGTRVFKDFVVGHLGNVPVRAPFDGILRGIARDGTEVPAGVKLLEIDSRGRRANWTGIDDRGRLIANAVAAAISSREPTAAERTGHSLHLVK